MGYPGLELYDVSPRTRLQATSSGCIVFGGEWMLQRPNNLVLAVLTSVFGPMRGAYDGPYPSEGEVEMALRGAFALALSEVQSDRVVLAGREIRLRPGLGQQLADALRVAQREQSVAAALWRDRVLVLQFSSFLEELGESTLLALVDTQSGKIIAYRGDALHWRLPRQWR